MFIIRSFYVIAIVALLSGCDHDGGEFTVPFVAGYQGAAASSARPDHAKLVLSIGFGGSSGDSPLAPLIEYNGLLYGTMAYAGTGCATTFGCGTVFSIDPSSKAVTILYHFQGDKDGANPMGALLEVNGTLYGTTFNGGGGSGCTAGCGTVFSLTTSGQETVVHRFFARNDGTHPQAGLVAMNGLLYGTTTAGGENNNSSGTVYSFDPTSGTEKVVYSIGSVDSGAKPEAPLLSYNGLLYGIASAGGTRSPSGCPSAGCGTVFSIDPTSGQEKTIHSFGGQDDGGYPLGGLVAEKDRLYGTTYFGGGSGCVEDACGTVYAINPKGDAKIVVHFNGANGRNPSAGLISTGTKLYGTTLGGGRFNEGTVFEIGPTGGVNLVYSFTGPSEVSEPEAALMLANGILYGTATTGPKNSGSGGVFGLRQ